MSETGLQKPKSCAGMKASYFSFGDDEATVTLPYIPSWLQQTHVMYSKLPMLHAPTGTITLFTAGLCQKLHFTPSDLEFDSSSNEFFLEYKSLHDPHLKNLYHQARTVRRLIKQGFITPELKQLRTDVLPLGEKVWWGNFRYNWGVDRHGKWAEVDYPSTAYPAFACGSGNLVSADIVHWIARNSQYLHLYQGEDVTMAIWMSTILPTYINDKRWICDERCTPSELASAEHTPETLRLLWNNWDACGNPCGCEYEPP